MSPVKLEVCGGTGVQLKWTSLNAERAAFAQCA